jgi:hypothetical protein
MCVCVLRVPIVLWLVSPGAGLRIHRRWQTQTQTQMHTYAGTGHGQTKTDTDRLRHCDTDTHRHIHITAKCNSCSLGMSPGASSLACFAESPVHVNVASIVTIDCLSCNPIALSKCHTDHLDAMLCIACGLTPESICNTTPIHPCDCFQIVSSHGDPLYDKHNGACEVRTVPDGLHATHAGAYYASCHRMGHMIR